jgi:exonuclease SbcC
MRPEKLVMENFGPFAGRVELDFSRLEDIFLVTGKTGSGKTTIFDALCFALYGSVPGARSAYTARLRSDHAGEDAECMVSLEFSLGRRYTGTYRVERRPKQELKRKRGTGVTFRDETVILWERVNGELNILGNKKTEVNQKLSELIGLEAQEFFKIVLLPQGEFAEFLRQNTSDRQKVLGKLFPIEKARRVKELAVKQAAEAEAREQEARRALGLLQDRVGPDRYEETLGQARGAFEGAREQLKSLGEAETFLTALGSLRRREAGEEGRLDESRERNRRIAEQEGAVAEKRNALARSRTARPLGEFVRTRQAARDAGDRAAALWRRAGEDRARAQAALEEAERGAAEGLRQEGELLALRERRPALLELRHEEEELEAQKRELADTSLQTGDLTRRISRTEAELAVQGERIAATETLAAGGPALDARLEETRSRLELYKRFRPLAERRQGLGRERDGLEGLIGELEEQDRDREARIPLMADELGRLKDEQNQAEQDDMALVLAGGLKPGEACPVCGSREHPRPASARHQRFSRKERIEGMEKTLRDLERLQSAARAELQGKRAEAGRIAEELDRLEAEAAKAREESARPAAPEPVEPMEPAASPPPLRTPVPAPARPPAPVVESMEPATEWPTEPAEFAETAELPEPVLPDIARIDRVIGGLAGELNSLLAGQAKAREASRAIQQLYRQRAATQMTLGDLGKRLAAAAEREKNLAGRIAVKEDRRRELLASLPQTGTALRVSRPPRAVPAPEPAPRTAAEALELLNRTIAELEESLGQRREQREQAGQTLAASQAAERAAAQTRDQTLAALRQTEAALEGELAASPFAGAGELEASLLDPAAEAALEAEIQSWGEEKARSESQLAECQKNLREIRAGLAALKAPGNFPGPLPTLEGTGQLLETLEQRREQAERDRDAAFAKLNRLERDREELETARQYHDRQETRARELRVLADDLSGKNPQWQPFDSWLLGSYLAEIAGYATARLEKMSEYRYSLLPESQRQKGQRGYAGLDLTVFDAHTGKTRPCATLSGGESFLASISLALGLADSIQTRSGGVRLDAVFIDEGFGSLDEASLDKAMLILDELRDHRMVGLISHVADMRSRIPCQVEVVKTGSGSKILTNR